MLHIPVIYVKDKQAFSKKGGTLRLIGKPIDIAKKFHKDGTKLVHFVDLDAMNGNENNMDIYDNLTFILHLEVEGAKSERVLKHLLALNARVVIDLPTKLDLAQFAEKRRLLVGKVKQPGAASEAVFDLLYAGESQEEAAALLATDRRIILVNGLAMPKGRKKPFGILEELGD